MLPKKESFIVFLGAEDASEHLRLNFLDVFYKSNA